ncbi:class I SAM-dependent methyltransferase [Paenibacillus sp. FA6]|uniref:class I SAM-dependent methyltransferase n=1 Tax=Paenibacillus sp. FA6 TaxID=3413029 RepID=UPI003F654B2B
MDIKYYTESNREAWNEVTPLHQQARGNSIISNFKNPKYYGIDDIAINKLKEYGILGKNVAQICCNNGVETISLKKLGAEYCVGFDISDEAIEEANQLSENVNIPVTFVRTDIYEIPSHFERQFDIVYISVGTLGWMPDLELFFQKVYNLLRENGIVFIYEMHPIIDIFDENVKEIKYSYFKDTPVIDNTSLDYVGEVDYKSKTKYWFPHTMSNIIQGLIKQGINIEWFEELSKDISCVSGHLESEEIHLPLSYLLVGVNSKK